MRRSHPISQHQARSLSAFWITATVIVGISLFTCGAEGPVAAVQRSLKEQQFYYGEVNGQLNEETRSALRRYQIHQGLPVSGDMDSTTLQALQSASVGAGANTETAPAQRAEERSVRGRARNLVQNDRAFLEQLESNNDGSAPAQKPSAPMQPPRRAARDVKQTPPPSIAEPVERPRLEQAEPAQEPEPQERTSGITAAEARQFVVDYLDAAEQPTPEGEVSFFADRVDYFDSGKVNRRFIEKDQRNYYRRWSSRRFELLGNPEVIRSSENNATVRFRASYSLSGNGDASKGKIEEVMRLQRTNDGWQIAAIRERKIVD